MSAPRRTHSAHRVRPPVDQYGEGGAVAPSRSRRAAERMSRMPYEDVELQETLRPRARRMSRHGAPHEPLREVLRDERPPHRHATRHRRLTPDASGRASRRVRRDRFRDAQEDVEHAPRRMRPAPRPRSREDLRRMPRKRSSRGMGAAASATGAMVGTEGATELDDGVQPPTDDETVNSDVTLAAHDPPRSSRKRPLAPVPGGQVNTVKQGRMYPMTGIDNLGLLMEDQSYQTLCFSIYLFKTTLDYRTVREFFEVLLQLYPKYRYVVDFDPYSATRRDKKKRKEQERLAKASPEEQETRRQELDQAAKVGRLPPNPGPRTWYSKSLKAGSWLRPAKWRIDDDFHVSENINVMSCGGHGDEAQLYRIAGRFLGRHFDFSKPVWEALLVQGLNTEEGAKSALMIKIHHSFSDGQGMIQSYHAALTALDKGVGIKEVQQWVDLAKKKEKGSKEQIKPTFMGTASHIMYTLRELYFRRRRTFVYKNPRAPRSPQRLYAHSEGVSMEKIKVIRNAFSKEPMRLTLNDVAIALLARAMQIASQRTMEGKSDRRAAIFVPISRRPPGNWDLYNYTTGGIAWLKFPDPDKTTVEQQLAHVQKEMLRLKRSHLPAIWYKFFDVYCKHRLFYLPNYPGWRQFYYRAFSEYHVATNVPGPAEPVKFGKHQAYSYHVLPPSSPGKATMAIGMISYASDFSLAVSCDDVPEFQHVPRALCDGFREAAAIMIEAAERKLATSST